MADTTTSREHIDGIVVPTTHWDRDWYWPFERFRVKLIEMFAGVEKLWEENPDYTFTIDGQSIALEDYLQVLPERAELFKKMGAEGRLKAGPLYVLSDVWLTSGEAFIRNLLIGRSVADQFHATQDAVYQPDTFGFHPDLPSYIEGAGLDTFMAMRGAPVDAIGNQRFFKWQGPDGATIQVCRLRDGYANAARLGRTFGTGEIMDAKSSGIHPGFSMPDAVKKLGDNTEAMRDGYGAPHLFLAGVDHQIPQPELPEILKQTSDEHTSYHYGDLDEVAEVMRSNPQRDEWYVHRGQLHDSNASMLGGTISSRMYLKLGNSAVERLLTRSVEPAAAAMKILGINEPATAVLTHAWKMLMTVHPHDDITGCSADATHRDNENSIARAHQAADALERRYIWHLMEHYGAQEPGDDRHGFVCFNADATRGVQRVRVVIDCEGRFNWADINIPDYYTIVDEDGVEIPHQQLRRGPCAEHPHQQLEIELACELPPLQLRRFFIEPRRQGQLGGAKLLENEHLQAEPNANGSVSLKMGDNVWPTVGLFSDQRDVGDSYTFSPAPGEVEQVFTQNQLHALPDRGHSGMHTLGAQGTVPLAGGDIPVSATWSLASGEKHIQVDIEVDNTVEDHRLRWRIPLGFIPEAARVGHKIAEHIQPVRGPILRSNGTYDLPIHPADHYVAADDGSHGLALFSEFPFEYEIDGDHLCITLVRSVGMLSINTKELTRGPGAGPDTPTPEAQSLRKYQFRFAIRPFTVGENLLPEAIAWRTRALRGVIWGANADHKHQDSSLLSVDDDQVQIMALKPAQDGNGLVLRILNPTPETRVCSLSGELANKEWTHCDHLERLVSNERTGLRLQPWEQRSFRFS